MNTNEISEKWKSLLAPIFPQGVEIRLVPKKSNLTLHVDWLLGADEPRGNKRSKLIELIISSEAVGYYKNKSTAQQKKDDNLLFSDVKNKYERHNPEHDKGERQLPPSVKWIVTTKELNS